MTATHVWDTHTHACTPDKLTWLAVRKTSIPGSSLAEIPSCWLVNKAGTAFPVVNKKSLSIQSKRKGGGRRGEGELGRRNEGKKTNDTVTQTSKKNDGDRAGWRGGEREQRWGRKKEQKRHKVSWVREGDDMWRAGDMELCGMVMSRRGVRDASRRSGVTRTLHSALLCFLCCD